MAFCTLFLSADEVDAWLDDNGKEKVTVGKTKTEIPPEIQEELHKMFQKESQETDKNVNIHANVLIITGNGGSGSGFKAKIGDCKQCACNSGNPGPRHQGSGRTDL